MPMTCQCYQIGGPFIAEDPTCPVHGREAVDVVEGLEDRIRDLENALSNLVRVTNDAAQTYNFSMCDEEINKAKELL